jgi:16S rRNA (adenine1518-N6/adenine1519-N6)-dimethyltransferase
MFYPPNKGLGQNFLFDKNYLRKIVNNCPINPETIIIEIGSGYGSLTNLLAETNCQKIISLEKDKNLFQWLEKNNKNEKVIYLNQDALAFNWEKFCLEYQNSSIIIVGNLPYYITNSLIVNLLFNYRLFTSLVFLVQKEVGQKWAASPHKYFSQYSSLSVFINYLAEIKIVLEVPSRIFNPSPSVDGVLVIINPYKNSEVAKEQLTSFLGFLKNCFRFRRKTLWNNLLSFSGNLDQEWEKYFSEKNYPMKIRPQNLTAKEYYNLFLYWKSLNKC